ncbi:MAG: hypothetical protein KatS3mg027_0702 [Bacteroidia bacterium]|nr:MAG: hypothetical protein KatS3mg027_0702 [Bacteroidia bacterium]
MKTIRQNILKKLKKLSFITLSFSVITQTQAQSDEQSERYKRLKGGFDQSEMVFEGSYLKSYPSEMTKDRRFIYTLHDYKITKLFKGTMPPDSIVKIETDNGSVYDPETGLIMETFSAHSGNVTNHSKIVCFLWPKNERGHYRIMTVVDISNPKKLEFNINPWEKPPYLTLEEFYADLHKISGYKESTEKKNPDIKPVKKEEVSPISPAEKQKNFYNLLATKLQLAKSHPHPKPALANELTLQLANPVYSNGIYEFDVNIKANTNSTYLDKVISDFDIFINNKYLSKFFYDTTSAALSASKIDFLEVMYHEIGHGVGLMHVIDSSDIMYYRSLGPLSYSIPGAQRRKPMPYTSAVDGVNTQISTSAVTISGQCGFEDMVQLNAGSCSFISVEEYLKNKLNVVIYPNPSENGIFNLSFDIPDENVKPVIEIFDIVGKKIYSETLPISFNKHYSHQMNIGNTISKGMYLLVIRSGPIYASSNLLKIDKPC